MDPYNRRILAALRDRKSRHFHQILSKVGFSYNTLRLHLPSWWSTASWLSGKCPKRGPGRPRFSYSLAKGVDGRALSAPYKGLVVLSFDKLQRICRHEKDGYCKEIRGRCTPPNCPKMIKSE